MEKLYSAIDITKQCNCSYSTFFIYACRPEFSHWQKTIINRKHYYRNVTKKDIELFKNFISDKKNRKNKNAN